MRARQELCVGGVACLCVALGLAPAFGADAAALSDRELPLLWTAELNTLLESAPTVCDIDGDGRHEALVAGREELFALDGTGKELWRWRTKGRFMTYPSVLERRGQPPLVYAADTAGVLTCLDGKGAVIWQAQLKGPSSWSAAVVCDLDGDGAREVIQTDEKGTVWAFDALTGKVRWESAVKGMPVSPAVSDLDDDGKLEVVVATGEGILAVVCSDGTLAWERPMGGASPTWSTCAPVVFGASDGRVRIAAASSDGWLFCVTGSGEELWRRWIRGPAASGISVGDLNLDGRADVLVATQLGGVYCFDETGAAVWEMDMQRRCLAAGAILDLNGDGRLEYVLCSQDGYLLVTDSEANLCLEKQFDHRTINVTPTFGDVTSNSPGLEMVITGGESGKVLCFRTPAPADTTAHWTSYRHDVRKTGAWFGLAERAEVGIVPENLAANTMFTGEPVRFVVHNPNPTSQPLRVEARCVRPDGSRQTAATRVLGKRGELLMPLDVLIAGTYTFYLEYATSGAPRRPAGSYEVFLLPFSNDRAIGSRAVQTLHAAADEIRGTLPASAEALEREALEIADEAQALAPMQHAAGVSDALFVKQTLDRTAAFVRRARRALAMADVIRKAAALGPGTSVVAFQGTLWENRAVDEQLPTEVSNPLAIIRRVVPGEHEPVSVKLFNITDNKQTVRATVEKADGGIQVTLHQSVPVPTSLGETSWDPLPNLEETCPLAIPSLSSRELWLDVAIGATVTPGPHRLTVRLQAIDGASAKNPQAVPSETVVALTLEVLPFEMAAPGAHRLCAWASLGPAEIEDLLAHGNNVFIGPLPAPVYDEQGSLTGFDYGKLDELLEPLRGHDVVVLLNGIPTFRDEFGSPGYQNHLKRFLDDLVNHMAGFELDTDHFALYPVDEPAGHGIEAVKRVVDFGKLVRAAHPKIRIYINGGGELPVFQQMAPYADIWCPGLHMLPEQSPEMNFLRSTGKPIWSYNCAYPHSRPIGANLKNINIVAEYRIAALFALRYGATGTGYWSYNIGEDMWTRTDTEYPMVYRGKTKPVTSRRWEAVREGIEDCRILMALQSRLSAGEGPPLTEDARRQIKRLIEVSLPGIIDQGYAEMKLGLARNIIDASNNDHTIGAFREEMMDCVGNWKLGTVTGFP